MVKSSKGAKRPKRCKKSDTRPARARYWASGHLALRKVRNLVRSGFEPMKALALWEATRKRKKGEIHIAKIAKLKARSIAE